MIKNDLNKVEKCVCKDLVLKQNKKVLLLGVGGVSMCQLAAVFKDNNCQVFGYDTHLTKTTLNLEKSGVKTTNKFNKRFVNVDFCVKTAAIKNDNPYIAALQAKKVPIFDRAEVLGELLKTFKCVIAVAGTHGKSTTSALIYEILRQAGKNVSCHIGAEVEFAKFNPGDDFVVVEACEFNKSFLHIYSNISVVTNVEPEHMDCYGSLKNLQNAFATFAKRAKLRYAFATKTTKFLQKYKNMHFVKEGAFKSKLKGEYNQKNISLAVAVCRDLGVDEATILKAVESFAGLPRRYEFIGNYMSTKIYIDYAHHPTELDAFITTFKQEYPNSLIIFQPHTYSRTKMFLKEFVDVLNKLDNVCIFKEYPAREQKKAGLSAKFLAKIIKQSNSYCLYLPNKNKLSGLMQEYDAVAFVGAGDIVDVARSFVEKC